MTNRLCQLMPWLLFAILWAEDKEKNYRKMVNHEKKALPFLCNGQNTSEYTADHVLSDAHMFLGGMLVNPFFSLNGSWFEERIVCKSVLNSEKHKSFINPCFF